MFRATTVMLLFATLSVADQVTEKIQPILRSISSQDYETAAVELKLIESYLSTKTQLHQPDAKFREMFMAARGRAKQPDPGQLERDVNALNDKYKAGDFVGALQSSMDALQGATGLLVKMPSGQRLENSRQRSAEPGADYPQFFWAARAAYDFGSFAEAVELTNKAEKAIRTYPDSTKPRLHNRIANLRGASYLAKGDAQKAEEELLSSAYEGDYGANGPSMFLAQKLFEAGHTATVLDFIQKIKGMKNANTTKLAAWEQQLRSGQRPDFGSAAIQ